MTTTAARGRTDAGWYLVGQLCLVFAAVLWGPFGARDAGDVSDVLPALHPALFETPATVAHDRVQEGDRAGTHHLAHALALALALPGGLRRPRRRSATPAWPTDTVAPLRPAFRRHGGSRAPPSPR